MVGDTYEVGLKLYVTSDLESFNRVIDLDNSDGFEELLWSIVQTNHLSTVFAKEPKKRLFCRPH